MRERSECHKMWSSLASGGNGLYKIFCLLNWFPMTTHQLKYEEVASQTTNFFTWLIHFLRKIMGEQMYIYFASQMLRYETNRRRYKNVPLPKIQGILWGNIMSLMFFCWLIFFRTCYFLVFGIRKCCKHKSPFEKRRIGVNRTQMTWNWEVNKLQFVRNSSSMILSLLYSENEMGKDVVRANCVDGMKFKAFAYTTKNTSACTPYSRNRWENVEKRESFWVHFSENFSVFDWI